MEICLAKNMWERFPAFTTAVKAYLLVTLSLSKAAMRCLTKK